MQLKSWRIDMTRQEAMTFAISVGKPTRHSSFAKGEFVRYKGKELVDEEGTTFLNKSFGLSVQVALGKINGKNIKMIKYEQKRNSRAIANN